MEYKFSISLPFRLSPESIEKMRDMREGDTIVVHSNRMSDSATIYYSNSADEDQMAKQHFYPISGKRGYFIRALMVETEVMCIDGTSETEVKYMAE